jgi:hypothetical protein
MNSCRCTRSSIHFQNRSDKLTSRCWLAGMALFFAVGLTACGTGGGKTTTLALETNPTTVAGGSQTVFTAFIDHNNGQFMGANWTLTSKGAACSPGCGNLANPTNNGSPGNGDTATITYTAPSFYANPVTITATSVENPSSSGSDTLTIQTQAPQLAVQPQTLGAVVIGVGYLPQTLQAIGGVSPYIWSVGSGNLPAGMQLSSSGVVSGTPTAGGVSNFEVQVQDSVGSVAMGNQSIDVVDPQSLSITGVTIHPGSTDPQLATITTSDGSQVDLWGDKDANGLAIAARTIQVQTAGASPSSTTFTLDSSGNLIQFQGTNGTVFNLSWQANVGTVVGYTPDGNAIVGPFQITLPTAASAIQTSALNRQRSVRAATATSVPLNDFQVQVNHCSKPAQDATVKMSLADSLQPSVSLSTIYAEQSAPGIYDAQIPVLIPSAVQATAVSYCDSVAAALQPIADLVSAFTTAQSAVNLVCATIVAVPVIATDGLVAPVAAEVYEGCVVAIGATSILGAVYNGVQLASGLQGPSPLRSYCDNGIPAIANLINKGVIFVEVTASIPGQAPITASSPAYGGQGPFPGSGLSPIVVNFNTGGACDIVGNWSGGWSRVDGQGTTHTGTLSAAIANSAATPGTYVVDLTVTDSHGATRYIFPGTPTEENQLGTSFGFGPAVVEGVSGTAEGFLVPNGTAMGGTFAGQAKNAAGGWNMIKQ